MVHYGFHDWIDIAGGIIVALLIVCLFELCRQHINYSDYIWGIILLVITWLCIVSQFYRADLDYNWLAAVASAQVVFFLCWICNEIKPCKVNWLRIFIENILLLSAIFFQDRFEHNFIYFVFNGIVVGYWVGCTSLNTYSAVIKSCSLKYFKITKQI
jgi:hypothetical protein